MINNNQQGSMLIVVIAAIVVFGAISAGVASLVSTGVRTSVDHSLSIQALYLAESGLEWTGYELRDKYCDGSEWQDICLDLPESPQEIDGGWFKIQESEVYQTDQGCEVKILGWSGSDNPGESLASRRIKALISKDFITAKGDLTTWEAPYKLDDGDVKIDAIIKNDNDVTITLTSNKSLLENIVITGEDSIGPNSLTITSDRNNHEIKNSSFISAGTFYLNLDSNNNILKNSFIQAEDSIEFNFKNNATLENLIIRASNNQDVVLNFGNNYSLDCVVIETTGGVTGVDRDDYYSSISDAENEGCDLSSINLENDFSDTVTQNPVGGGSWGEG